MAQAMTSSPVTCRRRVARRAFGIPNTAALDGFPSRSRGDTEEFCENLFEREEIDIARFSAEVATSKILSRAGPRQAKAQPD